MNVLYYCPEYYCRHGGRTHARGFFGALQQLSAVSQSLLYPKSNPQIVAQVTEGSGARRGKLWFLPETLRRAIQFFVPRNSLTRVLIDEIRVNKVDALVIRTGTRQPSIRRIKKACPDTTVCLEINSAYFDEALPDLPFRSLFQKWEVKRYNHADAIVVVSGYLKKYLEERGIAADKILVNQNGVDAGSIDIKGVTSNRDLYGIPPESFVIGYIGGMEIFRRLPEVIGYIAEMRRAGNDDIYCVLVGDGVDMPAVRTAIESRSDDLGGSVKLAGWQEHSEVPKFLSMFDIAIFPFTNAYCSPLKLFEYLGAGIPTIGPDTPAVREVFEDGVHLRLVNQDGSDFINAILEMKANPQLRAELSARGQQLVLEEYTWKRNAERVVQHIQALR